MNDLHLIATAAFGVEKIVVRELADLGYHGATVEDGRVHFRGDLMAICRTNLWLRCAERIQVVIGDFKARDFDDLFDTVKELEWEQWLADDSKFPVTARCIRAMIHSVPSTQKMVKRAIVERLRKVYLRHWFAETGTEYKVDCNILGERALLTLDTTGDGLHKRGYRKMVSTAPLRETIAAALVKLSYWNKERLLIDPFCGSGTIPIEAAMIARNLAPGRNRQFAAEDWPQLPPQLWNEARQEANDVAKPHLKTRIVARDQDKRIIKAARENARLADVSNDILFENKEFYTFPTDREHGCLICNPPYGDRISDKQSVKQLHADMGELLTPLDTWSLYVLTGAERFEKEFGKRADRRRKLFNARIACTYYQYLGPKPPRPESETIEPAIANEVEAETVEQQESAPAEEVFEEETTIVSESVDQKQGVSLQELANQTSPVKNDPPDPTPAKEEKPDEDSPWAKWKKKS